MHLYGSAVLQANTSAMAAFSRAGVTADGGPRYIRFTGRVRSGRHRDGRESTNSRMFNNRGSGYGVRVVYGDEDIRRSVVCDIEIDPVAAKRRRGKQYERHDADHCRFVQTRGFLSPQGRVN